MLHEDLKRFFDGFPRDAHPMAVLSIGGQRAVDVLPGQPRPVRPRAGRDLHRAAAGQGADHRRLRLQEVHRAAVPLPGQLAGPSRELPADVLRFPGRAVRGQPDAGQGARPAASILHADHEQNCSTSTVRLVGSSHANLFASVSAGINALLRPAARRRQPGGAGDARTRSGATAATSTRSSSGSRTRSRASS